MCVRMRLALSGVNGSRDQVVLSGLSGHIMAISIISEAFQFGTGHVSY